jgi:histidine kinase
MVSHDHLVPERNFSDEDSQRCSVPTISIHTKSDKIPIRVDADHHHRPEDNKEEALRTALDFQFLEQGLLFDRRQQIQDLREALQRRLRPDSVPELILIGGASGTGKTVLARKLRRPVQRQGGFFVMGKFDQLQRSEPFAPLVAAMTEFVWNVLENDEHIVNQIKTEIKEKVGNDIRVLMVLVPALEELIGPSEEGSLFILKSADAEERLKAIFVKFIKAACSCSRPLVLVMDDVQWADLGSLELLEAVVSDQNNHGLAVVAIYRANEVSFNHDFAVIVRRLEDEKNVRISSIEVDCLSLQAANSLVASVLKSPENDCIGVTNAVYSKTKGNVFFIVEFLKALFEDGVLTHDGVNTHWLWNDELWASKFENNENNILNLTTARIKRLPQECQQLLLYAACLGTELDESLLSKLFVDSLTVGVEEKSVLYGIVESLQHVNVDDTIMRCAHDGVITKESHSLNYRFLHDRVKEAAYNLVPKNDHPSLHLSLGRFLSKILSQEELEEYIFVVVDQMSRGLECIDDQDEKIYLASLFLLAGKKAIVSSDFKTSLKFLDLGLDLLNLRQSWRDEYHLTLNLYNTMAQTSCCQGDFARTDEAVRMISSNARCFEHELHGLMLQIYSFGIRLRLKDCLELGLAVLKRLGESFPNRPGIRHVLMDLVRVKRILRNMSDSSIMALPDMKDPSKLSAMGVLNLLLVPCFLARPDLYPLISYRMIKLSLRYGSSAISAVAFSSYGVVLANTGDADAAYRVGQLGLSFIGRYNSIRNDWIPRVYAAHYGMIACAKEPINAVLDKLSHAHQIGMECGDAEFGFVALHMCRVGTNFAGYSLVSLEPKMKAALELLISRNQTLWFEMTTLCYEAILALMGKTSDPAITNGCLMTLEHGSDKLTEVLQTANLEVKLYLCAAATHRLVVAYHDRDFDLALKMAKKSRKTRKLFAASPIVPYQVFYDALTCLTIIRQKQVSGLQKHKLLFQARNCLSYLRKTSEAVPDNYMHRVFVLEAEFLALQRKPAQALSKYSQAQDHARVHGFLDVRAIACEREALTRLEFGKAEPLQCYAKAIRCYEEWGAFGKSERMKRTALDEFATVQTKKL